MTCNCAEEMNALIADSNTKLCEGFRIIDGHLVVIPTLLATEKIVSSMGKKMVLVVPSILPVLRREIRENCEMPTSELK